MSTLQTKITKRNIFPMYHQLTRNIIENGLAIWLSDIKHPINEEQGVYMKIRTWNAFALHFCKWGSACCYWQVRVS